MLGVCAMTRDSADRQKSEANNAKRMERVYFMVSGSRFCRSDGRIKKIRKVSGWFKPGIHFCILPILGYAACGVPAEIPHSDLNNDCEWSIIILDSIVNIDLTPAPLCL